MLALIESRQRNRFVVRIDMACKTFICISLIVFVNVQCDEIKTSASVGLKRAKAYIDSDEIRKQIYKSNHPPIADERESVPDAIVFQDDDKVTTESSKSSTTKLLNFESSTDVTSDQNTSSTKKSESQNLPNDDSNEPYKIILDSNANETKKALSANKQKVVDVNSNNERELKENNTRRSSKSRNVYEIPVEIVYEAGKDKSKAKEQIIVENERKQIKRLPTHRMRENTNSTQKTNKDVATSSRLKNDVTVNTTSKQMQPSRSDRKRTSNRQKETKMTDIANAEATDSDSKSSKETRKQEFKRRSGQKTPVVPIVESESYLSLRGAFHYKYEGGDGTKAYEQGELKNFGDEKTGESVVGGYSYKDKDGKLIEVTYTADERGYIATGAHLPTPPPVPAAIARALAHLATKTTPPPDTLTTPK